MLMLLMSINLIVQCFALCYPLFNIPYFVLHAFFVTAILCLPSLLSAVATVCYCLRSRSLLLRGLFKPHKVLSVSIKTIEI
ncbi:hypothetical protein BGX38DRAFT_1215168 [Terfezia claveryi]|nr:hypothetical protein BGX38DRAFT_1215168 [Terfezia claveryi]